MVGYHYGEFSTEISPAHNLITMTDTCGSRTGDGDYQGVCSQLNTLMIPKSLSGDEILHHCNDSLVKIKGVAKCDNIYKI